MRNFQRFLFVLLCLALCIPQAHAEVESEVAATLKLQHPPIDMEVSLSGKRIYVLDDHGQVLICNPSGSILDTIQVGSDIAQIKIGPGDDVLFLSNPKENTIQVLNLTFIHTMTLSDSPSKGPANAPVAIVVFSDFQCPYCARIGEILDKVSAQYPKEVKSVFKHYPLPSHRFAMLAAKATVAADSFGKFWEFHDLIFKNYSQLNEQKIEEFRTMLDLDKAKFDKRMNDPRTLEKIQKDQKEGEDAGITGTPTLFVNGRMVRPASLEGIKAAVEKALKDLKKK
ncbi:MAG: thioredoxin domain-containing protein [Desulfatitalea sp.]